MAAGLRATSHGICECLSFFGKDGQDPVGSGVVSALLTELYGRRVAQQVGKTSSSCSTSRSTNSESAPCSIERTPHMKTPWVYFEDQAVLVPNETVQHECDCAGAEPVQPSGVQGEQGGAPADLCTLHSAVWQLPEHGIVLRCRLLVL